MDRGHTVAMFFQSYIVDYLILNAFWATMEPVYGFQKLTLPPTNQTKWWGQQEPRRRQVNINLGQTGTPKQIKLNRRQSEVQKHPEIHLWRARTQKQIDVRLEHAEVRKQADLRLGPARARKPSKLRSGQARARKRKKKRLSLSTPVKVETRTLSNIKDQRKQFHNAPTQSGGQINQDQVFQNQWHSPPDGQKTPKEYQRNSAQIRTLMNHSRWGRLKNPMQFQNQSEFGSKSFQSEGGLIGSRGQIAPMQFQRESSQLRGPLNPVPIMPYKMGISHRGLVMNPNKVGYSSSFLQRGDQRGRLNNRRPWNQYPKKLAKFDPFITTPKPKSTGTRSKAPTSWASWIPPHLITDIYYPDGFTPAPKGKGEGGKGGGGKGKGSGEKGKGGGGKGKGGGGKGKGDGGKGKGGDDGDKMDSGDDNSDLEGNFLDGYNPNEPRYGMTATIPKSTTLTPTTPKGTAGGFWVRISKTSVPSRPSFANYCDDLKHWCMRAYTTGTICARTVYFTYLTYPSYCLMDYVNCVEQLEVWQIVHTGQCFHARPLSKPYHHYAYMGDDFLDQNMIEDPWEQYRGERG